MLSPPGVKSYDSGHPSCLPIDLWSGMQLVTTETKVFGSPKADVCTNSNFVVGKTYNNTSVRKGVACARDNMCSYCHQKWRNKVYAKAACLKRFPDDTKFHFVTLTIADDPNNPNETFKELNDRFRKCWRAFRKNEKMTYFRVFEFGSKNWRIHAHLIIAGDCPFPEAPKADGKLDDWIASLSDKARGMYERLSYFGLGMYSCELLYADKGGALKYISKYVAKSESFPWKDITGIQLYHYSNDWPSDKRRPQSFAIKATNYVVAEDKDPTTSPDYCMSQEYAPELYAAQPTLQALDTVKCDIDFQLEACHTTDLDTHYDNLIQLQKQFTYISTKIPTDVRKFVRKNHRKKSHYGLLKQYVYQHYELKIPSSYVHSTPELQQYSQLYNEIQRYKKYLRIFHNYSGTWSFLKYYFWALRLCTPQRQSDIPYTLLQICRGAIS